MAAKVCVVVLCGLPASGKTTLCSLLKDNWSLFLLDQNPHILHICFDDLIPSDSKLKFDNKFTNLKLTDQIQNDVLNERTWKDYRRQILNCFEKLLISFKMNDFLHSKTFDCTQIPEASDRFFSKMWERMLSSLISGHKGCTCLTNDHTEVADSDNKNKSYQASMELQWDKSIPHIFLIDDNMFYRSMRYEYFQVARTFSCGFSQVHLHCPFEVVQSRNSSRQRQEMDKTLTNMYKQLEQPDPDICAWERYSITFDTSSNISSKKYRDLINNLIIQAMANPTQPIPEEDLEEKELSRQACTRSMTHQTDQIIRKYISKIMNQKKEKATSKNELHDLGKELNQQRKEFLEHLKTFGLEKKTITCGSSNYLASNQTCTSTNKLETNVNQANILESSFNPLVVRCRKDNYHDKGKLLDTNSKSLTTCDGTLQTQSPRPVTEGGEGKKTTEPTYFLSTLLELKDENESKLKTYVDEKGVLTQPTDQQFSIAISMETIPMLFVDFCVNKFFYS